MINPFAVTTDLTEREAVFGDHARRIRSAFLYRVIELERPIEGTFLYTGWWFRQKIEFSGRQVWFRISWLRIFSKAEFSLPTDVDSEQRIGRVEIDFTRGLRIRRFRIWIDDQLVYDEIT